MYYQFRKKNLPIYGIAKDDLKSITTTEKDAEKKIYRHPGPELRLFDEDIYQEDKKRKSLKK